MKAERDTAYWLLAAGYVVLCAVPGPAPSSLSRSTVDWMKARFIVLCHKHMANNVKT
jgi:hypothetical protein